VLFSGLAPCDSSGSVVLLAHDPLYAVPDTLSVDPGMGALRWHGGPARGFAGGGGDTLLVATLAGVVRLAGGAPAGTAPWVRREGSVPGPYPETWPLPRSPLGELTPPTFVGGVTVFPRRYVSLRDSSRVFLTDADSPPRPGLFLDLHTRASDGVEWLARRNLEIRTWVLPGDSLHWAFAAREHRPDYGGEIREVVVVGRGHRTDTFAIGRPLAMMWDSLPSLWVLTARGSLVRLRPGRDRWTQQVPALAAAPSPCPPGGRERVWVWMSPGRYQTEEAAAQRAHEVRTARPSLRLRAWAVPAEPGLYAPVWGGGLTEELLVREIAESPVPGAERARVVVHPRASGGPVGRAMLATADGEAVLRLIRRGEESVSELWWRYDRVGRWNRLAGPWDAPLDRLRPPASVDAPEEAP
jgi:hypothetical protein